MKKQSREDLCEGSKDINVKSAAITLSKAMTGQMKNSGQESNVSVAVPLSRASYTQNQGCVQENRNSQFEHKALTCTHES